MLTYLKLGGWLKECLSEIALSEETWLLISVGTIGCDFSFRGLWDKSELGSCSLGSPSDKAACLKAKLDNQCFLLDDLGQAFSSSSYWAPYLLISLRSFKESLNGGFSENLVTHYRHDPGSSSCPSLSLFGILGEDIGNFKDLGEDFLMNASLSIASSSRLPALSSNFCLLDVFSRFYNL